MSYNKELLPCPFCGVELAGEGSNGDSFHEHPKNACFFSEWEFDRLDYAQWNGRTAQPVVLTDEHVRSAGGIVHKDGNIFFTNIGKLNAAILAAREQANV